MMKHLLIAIALLMAGAPARAASGFDGHWVEDLKTEMGQAGFDDYLVEHGIYKCRSCRPPREYPADGKLRSVPGDVSVISESVRIAGPRTIATRIVDHEMVRETTMTVAPDGQTAIYVSLDKWPGRPTRLRTAYLAKRTAPAPAGAHAVSGSWLGERYLAVPEEYRSIDLREANGQFSRSNFRHGRYTAAINGATAPVTGDGKNIFRAAVRAPDARTRVETISLNGTPLVERTYALSADGKSLATTVRDPKDGSVFSAISHRGRLIPSAPRRGK
jgi:hypothetical protein